ncbi:MAG: T9SS type A sorting domain-containing protein, partial [Chitinophagales bacterium]
VADATSASVQKGDSFNYTYADDNGCTITATITFNVGRKVRRRCRYTALDGGKTDLSLAFIGEVRVYPNPFDTYTTIDFMVSDDTEVEANLYAIDGRKVAEIFSGEVEGESLYRWTLNAADLPTATYILQIVTATGEVYIDNIYVVR